jgi:hypothetical protein
MKAIILLALLSLISTNLVNPSNSNGIESFSSLNYKYTALEGIDFSSPQTSYFYKSVTGIPTIVISDKHGTIHFINLIEKRAFERHELKFTKAWSINHAVRNGSDYVFIYSLSNGVLSVFKNGKLHINEYRAYHNGLNSSKRPSVAIYKNYVIVKSSESPLALFKFNKDYTKLELIDSFENDSGLSSLLKADKFYILNFNNVEHLCSIFDNSHIEFYTIEKDEFKVDHVLNAPGMIGSIAVAGEYLYTRDRHSVYRYIHKQMRYEKVYTLENDVIINFDRLNDGSLIVEGRNHLVVLNVETNNADVIEVSRHSNVAIYDRFVAIVEHDGTVEIYETRVNDKLFLF